MESRASSGQAPGRHASFLALGLSAVLAVVGCSGDPGPDPTIKVEQGAGVKESVKGNPAAAKRDPAPVQRTKGGRD